MIEQLGDSKMKTIRGLIRIAKKDEETETVIEKSQERIEILKKINVMTSF